MPASAEDAANASKEWLVAQKIRRSVSHELDHVKKSAGDGSEIEHFEKLDELMAEYRFKCVHTLWLDIEFATKEKVESALWTTHVWLNSSYRKVKQKYEKSQHTVTKRKIEKLYENYLKVTQGFYKGHLQRLCARYRGLPELRRLVEGGIVDRLDGLGDNDCVDAVAAGINKQVLASCYLILNYLGDLWRYRTQLQRPKRRTFDTSLAYYRLANDLDPRSGYAYHQMGVIFLEQEKHFDIVYHFYRSLAAEQPHPSVATNLEFEFKKVLQSPASPRGQGSHHALQDWVVRLHAHFYRGRDFPQHAELEEEVLHRFSLAVKAHDFVDGLLKMALINICSYQVAKDKITGDSSFCLINQRHADAFTAEWTPEGSQSCQFTLRLNIRTICVILNRLEPELSDMVNNMRSSSGQSNNTIEASSTKDDSKFNALVSAALPLLRVYMTWLCMYRSDIVQFESHLQPYIVQMYKSLSAVLSSLFEVLSHYPRLEPVPYLFKEDMEALGLKALNGAAIPSACLLGTDSITRVPKSRPEEAGDQNFRPEDLSFTRALDITTCAVVLVDDPEFPLAISQASDGLHLATVTYLAAGKPSSPAAVASMAAPTYTSPTAAAAELSAMLGVRPSPTAAATELVPRTLSAHTPNLASVTNGFTEALTLHGGQQLPLPVGLAVSPYPPQLAEESNYAVDHDSRMNDLVNGLVEPSESDPSEAVLGQDETSYGMHTATARDVFEPVLPSTSPGLTNRNGLPSLPWSWGSVAQPTSHQRGISSGSPRSAWPDAAASPQPVSTRNSTGGVSSYGNTQINNTLSNRQYAPGYQMVTESATSTTSSAQANWHHGRQHSSGNHGTSTATGLPGQTSYGSSNPWSQSSSKFSSIHDILGAQLGALVPGVRPVASTPGPINPVAPSSFASTNFSGNSSSLPPVNSPWGVPNRAAGGSAKPGPIGRPTPPSCHTNSRPNSNGNGVGFSSLGQDNSVLQRPAAKQSDSRSTSGPTTPGLRAAPINGNANGLVRPAQSQDDAYEAMLRKLQKPKS
ncbi:hypothetical protein CONLIGDRAFT_695949 [Coniochaeta ligniaria NRRL 30616]|uniref:Nonsense-mediated mRNA decay factor n=1 Tax=Coniochaeta ligniaria NRRL 30616 TaxID=1408157 RepID=A0A1J7JJ72_9PEZI|nr:hypothetical protein CONLIGDRAFT_695949 [Coniochaeta ligniaria NRRL 30616]